MEKKIVDEKENMKVQQAAFDKILPGVQARCAVFFMTYLNLMSFIKITEMDTRGKNRKL